LAYRRQKGEKPLLDDYREFFPENRERLEVIFLGADTTPSARSVPSADGRFDGAPLTSQPFDSTPLNPTDGNQSASAGRFHFLRSHAKGGLGQVSVALDDDFKREVALKEIQPRYADDPESKARFLREALLTGRLEHPGIVPVYGLGYDRKGQPFYAMRLIQGETLKAAVEQIHAQDRAGKERGELAVQFRRLLGQFIAVCNTIAFAHSRGVLHRDIKPANIMLGKYGETLVVDWGLAKHIQQTASSSQTDPTLQVPCPSNSTETTPGSAIGTPAFMSPEQAAGSQDNVGHASDVYSLGATLYFVLTGRPPFEGENVDNVLQHVQQGAFPPPRRVNPRVHRALAAICQKAMSLRPEDRYQSAVALAADIEHWLADEPVSAHPEPVGVKIVRWARKHKPLVSGAVAAFIVFLMAASAGIIWNQQLEADRIAEQLRRHEERERTEKEIGHTLAQTRDSRRSLQMHLRRPGGVFLLLNDPADWQRQIQVIESSLEKAKFLFRNDEGLLSGALGNQLQALTDHLHSDQADLTLALELEKVRQEKAMPDGRAMTLLIRDENPRKEPGVLVEGKANLKGALQAYSRIFEKLGFPLRNGNETKLAIRIKNSPIREQLLGALDDWALAAWENGKRDLVVQILTLARRADSDPWANAVRNLKVWQDRRSLEKLVLDFRKSATKQGRSAGPSLQMLTVVGFLLTKLGGDAESWLREVQADHPADFWLNMVLGETLLTNKPADALAFYRAALATRPKNVAVHNSLGAVLHNQTDLDGAIRHFKIALEIAPDNAMVHNNMGLVLQERKDLDAAIRHFRKAVEIDPNYPTAHNNLGVALVEKKDLESAIRHYNKAISLNTSDVSPHNNLAMLLHTTGDLARAIRHYEIALGLDPSSARVHFNLAFSLYAKSNLTGAIEHLRKAIDIAPSFGQAHTNLGLALRAANDLDGAIEHFRKAIVISPNSTVAHNNLGNALTLRNDFDGAIHHFRKGLGIDSNDPSLHLNLGLALYGKKDYLGALDHYKRTVSILPNGARGHLALGQAQLELGDFMEARKSTVCAIGFLSPSDSLQNLARNQLQRCDFLLGLEQKTASILDGRAQAKDAAEELILADFCQRYKKQYSRALHFYKKVLSARPTGASGMGSKIRYNAACCAVLAAAGQGARSPNLTGEERGKLRRESIQWLKADLMLCRKQVHSGDPLAILQVAEVMLPSWQNDGDLKTIRETEELVQLPPSEQEECLQLWSDVDSVQREARCQYNLRQAGGMLTKDQRKQVHLQKTIAGRTYIIDLESQRFHPFLVLEDANGNPRAKKDNGGRVGQRAHVIFTPGETGILRIVATSHQGAGTGAYSLRIVEFSGR
jgi:tetratricopeptide (TPR) repeat protein/tRNA A-37 threonylcarbamoyl transferase component Bud32